MAALLLGLDLAIQSGYAYGAVGGIPNAGTIIFGGPDAMVDERGARLVRWLNAFLHEHPVDIAVIERPLEPRVLVEIGTVSDPLLTGHAFAGIAAAVLNLRGVRRIIWADSQKVSAHFCGRRRFASVYDPVKRRKTTSREEKKVATVNAARMRGWSCANDDEADALALWSYGCGRIDPRTAAFATPLFARGAPA